MEHSLHTLLKDQELMMLNTSCCFNVPSCTYKNGIWKLIRLILSFQPKKPCPSIMFISLSTLPPEKKTKNKISYNPLQPKPNKKPKSLTKFTPPNNKKTSPDSLQQKTLKKKNLFWFPSFFGRRHQPTQRNRPILQALRPWSLTFRKSCT